MEYVFRNGEHDLGKNGLDKRSLFVSQAIYERNALFGLLLGYRIKCKCLGDHNSDSCPVDYRFKFISPNNIKTKILAEMNFMSGWDYYKNEKLIRNIEIAVGLYVPEYVYNGVSKTVKIVKDKDGEVISVQKNLEVHWRENEIICGEGC